MPSSRSRKGSRGSRGKGAKVRSRGGRRSRPWLRRVLLGFGIGAFVVGFATGSTLMSLDRTVVDRFEGRRFRVPSRVFSAPTILYPGLDAKLVDLRGTLQRLGYRESDKAKDLQPGQYLWGRHHVRVHLRAFEHPSRPEPARDVVLRLDRGAIQEIRELPSRRELGAVMLEPEQLGAYYGPDREQRELVSLDTVPRHMVDAVLSVEDQRFETHPGIDVRRIGGALLANLRAGSVRQGGSTLTQQLVKNFFLTPERTLRRKLTEAAMALMVELRYEKREILEAYLNEIYLGQRGATAIHGVGEASRLYFGKRARDLDLDEAALLAAIIQSPNGISPYREPDRARERRNLVLDLMHEQGRISGREYARARERPLQLAAITPDPGDARYFLALLQRQLAEGYAPDVLESEGMRVYSTLDRRLQRIAAVSLREGLENLEKRFAHLATEDPARALQGCIVALRPQTGEILALVGGRDYRVSQFDRCTQARRQTGSVFKPFVYIAALEPRKGASPTITLASILDDTPLEVETPSGPWRPENFDHEFHDRVSVRRAAERSLNVATARLAQEVGIERVADVARRLGIESALPIVPSLALGTADVSPVEMARAYATLASGGVRPHIQSIEDLVDEEGATLERRELRIQRVIDAGTAYLATSLLEGVATRGTAAGVRRGGLEGPIAAKTGTTDDERDLWFVGYTPELVAVVWVGFDEPRSVGVQSSVGAMPIWRRFVTAATGGRVRGFFPRPREIERADIDPVTGAIALRGCERRREEIFLRGTLPETFCPGGEVAGAGAGGGATEDRSPGSFFEWLRRRL